MSSLGLIGAWPRPVQSYLGVLALLLLLAPAPARADGAELAGRQLTEVLSLLGEQGLDLIYNSRVVQPWMRVEEEPQATDPRQALEEILAPHGLTTREGRAGRLVVVRLERQRGAELRGVVRDRPSGTPLGRVRVRVEGTARSAWSRSDGTFRLALEAPGTVTVRAESPGHLDAIAEDLVVGSEGVDLVIDLEPVPRSSEEIVVTPSRFSLAHTEPTLPLTMDRELTLSTPRLSQDLLRGLTVLPGISGAEVSARISVRGGQLDQNLVLLDGVELFEPFHLNDYGGAVSIVAPVLVDRIEVKTGGFEARYGDRSSAVINMTTITPWTPSRTLLSAGVSDLHTLRSGAFGAGRGDWLGLGRMGLWDQALRFDGRRDRPDYWDLFAKIGFRTSPSASVTARTLLADDHLDFEENRGGTVRDYQTRYQSQYVWASDRRVLTPQWSVESLLSFSAVDRKREAAEGATELTFDLLDVRELTQVGGQQHWTWDNGRQHVLKGGFEVRQFEAAFDYASTVQAQDALAGLRGTNPSGQFEGRLRESQGAAYLSDRYRPNERLTIEAGLRFDAYSLTERSDTSPRLGVAYSFGRAGTVRLAWGEFVQNQRPYELQVTDGETVLARAERTEQWVLGYERILTPSLSLRVEGYRRVASNPRPRFENLFEPRTAFPEVQSDRFRVAPDRSEGQGAEVLLRGRRTGTEWWLHYARSTTSDRIEGRTVRRAVDQPHAATFFLRRQLPKGLDLGVIVQFHTGWPTTPVRLEPPSTAGAPPQPVLGELFSQRLPDYHRLDLRLGRAWELPRGRLDVHLDLQNVTNRRNVRGFHFEIGQEEGGPTLLRETQRWRGFYPSMGVRWTF